MKKYIAVFAGLLLLSIPLWSSATIYGSSLILWYRFDNADISGTSLTDKSVSNITGTINNSPTTGLAGILGQKISFEGAGTTYNVTASSSSLLNIFSSGGSVCFWTQLNSFGHGTSFGRWFDKSDGSDTAGKGWYMDSSDNGGGATSVDFDSLFGTTQGEWNTANGSIATTSPNRWYHICVTYKSSSVSISPFIYINGVSKAISTTTAGVGTSPNDNGRPLIIGNRSTNNRGMDGTMDDIRIYNRILSANEVMQLYYQGLSTHHNGIF